MKDKIRYYLYTLIGFLFILAPFQFSRISELLIIPGAMLILISFKKIKRINFDDEFAKKEKLLVGKKITGLSEAEEDVYANSFFLEKCYECGQVVYFRDTVSGKDFIEDLQKNSKTKRDQEIFVFFKENLHPKVRKCSTCFEGLRKRAENALDKN